MTTNAKGQLGGLDTTEAVRRRLASESSAFKCAICSRTNGEIIKECEDRAKEAGEPSDDVQVPEDLNLGFRDEMEAAKKNGDGKEPSSADDGAETTAQLAEGFVETVPIAADAGTTSSDTSAASAARARPAQSVPQPTSTVPTLPPRQQQQQLPQRPTDDGIPVWIDRMIVVLVVLLAALVLKVLFAF